MQSQQLPTESEIFKDEIFSGTESTDSPPQEMTERRDDGQNHGQNLIESRIKPISKTFILRIHQVLTRDSPHFSPLLREVGPIHDHNSLNP
jgi:hypothetical protein